jgi:hypothetical protein
MRFYREGAKSAKKKMEPRIRRISRIKKTFLSVPVREIRGSSDLSEDSWRCER